MSHGVDLVEAFACGAVLVDEIFRGSEVRGDPHRTSLELAHVKTAKDLELSIRALILARADKPI